MAAYQRFLFPLLRRVDAETAHERTLSALETAQTTSVGRALLRRIAGDVAPDVVQCGSLQFPNVLGMAAGFDKDARVVAGLALLGFGHVEVGTLTPRPQAGNPRPRIFRLPEDGALINRMGFPNGGVQAAVPRLRALAESEPTVVVGVSLGKQKETPLEEAAGDYIEVMRAVYPYVGYLAVNISSPNTPGLRELQGGRYLEHLLSAVAEENDSRATSLGLARRPLWVKIAPDLSPDELDDILAAVSSIAVDGIIATNTTLAREGLTSGRRTESGGLSGRPLRERSTAIINHIAMTTNGALPVIGAGGVESADDVRRKLDVGATLVQFYTALVYGGPGLPGRILRDLAVGR